MATLAGWTAESNATLVMTVRTNDEIIMAADSLRTIRTSPPQQTVACKIRNFGDFVFAASGGTSRPGGAFSLEAITASLQQGSAPADEPIESRFRRFDERTVAAFMKVHRQSLEGPPITFTYVVSFTRKGRPTAFARTLRSAGGIAEIRELEEVRDGEVLLTGQSEIVDHLAEVDSPCGESVGQTLSPSLPPLT